MRNLFLLIVPLIICVTSCSNQIKQSIPEIFNNDAQLKKIIKHVIDQPYFPDTHFFSESFEKLSTKQIELLVSNIDSLQPIMKTRVAIIHQIAKQLGKKDPAKSLEFLSTFDEEFQSLNTSYRSIANRWIMNNPTVADSFIFSKTIKWAGPAAQMGYSIRELWVENQLKKDLKHLTKKLDSIADPIQKFKMIEATFSFIYSTENLPAFANWIKKYANDNTYQDLCGSTATKMAIKSPESSHAWAFSLSHGAAQQWSICQIFNYLGVYNLMFAVDWFNNPKLRETQLNSIKALDNKLTLSSSKENLFSAFICGMLSNKETSYHPSKMVERVTAPKFRTLIVSEYNNQMRQMDPKMMYNEMLSIDVKKLKIDEFN